MWRNFIIVSGTIVVADQVTKLIADKYLTLSNSVPVMGDFFRLTLVNNRYGVWGMKLLPATLPAVMGICIIIVIFIFYKTKLMALSIICGGAIGNFIDRLMTGAVTDFLDFGIGRFRWAVFNIADAGITIGILLLILQSSLMQKKLDKKL